MTPWPATIIKDRSDDGFWVIEPASGYKIGQTVEIDLDSRMTRDFKSRRTDGTEATFKSEVVELTEDTVPKMLFPTELLEL